MKKFTALFLAFMLMLSMVSCADMNDEPPGEDTKPEVTDIIDNTKIYSIPCDDALEGFFSDSEYIYFFSCIKSQYIIVKYSDGSEKSVKLALRAGDITIADLDRYEIDYSKSPRMGANNVLVNNPDCSYCWVGCTSYLSFATQAKALNTEKISDNDEYLPIFKCENQTELESYKEIFPSVKWDEAPSFGEIADSFGANFFLDNTLFIVYVTANSGSYRFGVESCSMEGGTFIANIIQTNNPQWCTEDMAGWLIVFSVSRSLLSDVQSYNAVEIP